MTVVRARRHWRPSVLTAFTGAALIALAACSRETQARHAKQARSYRSGG